MRRIVDDKRVVAKKQYGARKFTTGNAVHCAVTQEDVVAVRQVIKKRRVARIKQVEAVRRTSMKARAVPVHRTIAVNRTVSLRRLVVKKQHAQVMRIAVLRHGATQANIERRYISRSDVPLSAEGYVALALARQRLAAERPLVFTSDMSRCLATLMRVCPHSNAALDHDRDTNNVKRVRRARHVECTINGEFAKYVRNSNHAKGVKKVRMARYAREVKRSNIVICDARLREMDFGSWEGLTYDDLRSDQHYCAWLDDMTTVIPPSGESWQQFAARTEAAWRAMLCYASIHRPRRAAHRGAKPIAVLIVTHGGVLRRLHGLAWPAASFWDIPAPTGGGYVLVAQRQGKQWRFLRTESLVD